MSFPPRPVAFVLVACNHGTMIVNRNDYHQINPALSYGVGHQILTKSNFEESEVGFVLALLDCRRRHFGDGIVAIDGGANIGVHTIEWARHMWGWGHVTAFEAQEGMYYALAGNIALNNCMNAHARLAALGESCGEMAVPQPDYFSPASFGSLELRQRADAGFIGQQISYDAGACTTVPLVNLDSIAFDRLDLIKLDVEGMELDVLRGARTMLECHQPILVVEVVKSDRAALTGFCEKLDYRVFPLGDNMLAVHAADPTLHQIEHKGNALFIKG